MSTEIITIGDELLIGQVLDTNSKWIAQQLNKVGIDVCYKTTVGDVELDILNAIKLAFSRVSIVLLTGGLGPTKDDITKNTLCKYFDTRLVFDDETLSNVEQVLKNINRNINELTRNQAYVPEGATIIQNKMGTAPITWFEQDGKVLVSMPGVPFEMKWSMQEEVIPRLINFFPTSDSIQHLTFWVKNYSESALAMHLETFERNLPDNIKLAYLPTPGLVRLRLTGKDTDKDILSDSMSSQRKFLFDLLQDNILYEDDEALEYKLHNLFVNNGLTLSLAESCTGGRLASLFTAIPGSSQYFKGGVVCYSNESKINLLGVNKETIEKEGAVSLSVVNQLVDGACKIFNTDCSIAISGIAGPDGGTLEKPVGTVCIAVRYKDQVSSFHFCFSHNRESNILRSCNTAMSLLLEMIS
ncbi:competence/damage-inducible protein A [Bacteroidales bacterium OttesenSCG-928-M11]|nr:competence/damage-inducible protein A [Bacteroidales bacterium OttesenSCG-928-M11]